MWVNSETFMKLVETATRLELKCGDLERRVEHLEKKPVVVNIDEKHNHDDDYKRAYDELMNGVVDKDLGRVRYTDGRD